MSFIVNPQDNTEIWYHGSSSPYLMYEDLKPSLEFDNSHYQAFYITSDKRYAEGFEDTDVDFVPFLYKLRVKHGNYFKASMLLTSRGELSELALRIKRQILQSEIPFITDEAVTWALFKIAKEPIWYNFELGFKEVSREPSEVGELVDSPIFEHTSGVKFYADRDIFDPDFGFFVVMNAIKALEYEGVFLKEHLSKDAPNVMHPSKTLALFDPQGHLEFLSVEHLAELDIGCRLCGEVVELEDLGPTLLCEDCED